MPPPPVDPAVRARFAAALPAAVQTFSDDLAARGIPDAALGVVYDGQLVYARGYGVRDTRVGDPVDASTIFRVGSITKVFTGAALLLLRDEGKLSLDDPAIKYLPELSQVVYPTNDSAPITLRHLVTHTSGLPRLGALAYNDGHELSQAEVLAGLKGLRLESAPGTQASYSNLGMALVGIVIGRVAGEDYRAFVRERILTPLGMHESGFDPSELPPNKLALGWIHDGDRYEPAQKLWRLGAASAMGGLYSSVADLSRFMAFELSAWPPRDDPETGPIRRSTLRESQSIAGFSPAGSQGFGVNWIVMADGRAGRIAFHNGSTEAYCSSMWLLPERGLGVVTLAGSNDSPALDAITRKLVESLGLATKPPPGTLPVPLDTAVRRVRQLLDRPERGLAESTFTPAFQRAVPPDRVIALFASLRQDVGACTDQHATVHAPTSAHVELACERGTISIELTVEAAPPYRVEGMLAKSEPPK